MYQAYFEEKVITYSSSSSRLKIDECFVVSAAMRCQVLYTVGIRYVIIKSVATVINASSVTLVIVLPAEVAQGDLEIIVNRAYKLYGHAVLRVSNRVDELANFKVNRVTVNWYRSHPKQTICIGKQYY